jgi:hypothetical protein
MKHFIKLKSKKGVTLTELLVGMGMFALFLSAISLLFSGLNRSRDTIIELAELNTLLDNVSAPIIRDITNATRELFAGCGCVPEDCDILFCELDPTCDGTGCACICHDDCGHPPPSTGIDEISIPLGAGGISIVYSICIDAACACGGENILVLDCRSVECTIAGDHHHPVLQKAFYKGKSVSFIVEEAPAASGVTYILTIIIYRDVNGIPSPIFNNEVIRRDYAIRPLSLNQFN